MDGYAFTRLNIACARLVPIFVAFKNIVAERGMQEVASAAFVDATTVDCALTAWMAMPALDCIYSMCEAGSGRVAFTNIVPPYPRQAMRRG